MGGQMEITHHNYKDNRTVNKQVHHHQGDLHQHTHNHHVTQADVIHHHGDLHQSHHVHYSDNEAGYVQIKDQSELAMVRDEAVFVDTWAYRAALQQVSEGGVLVLRGPPGSGKTCTAHALLRHFKAEGYTPLVLHRFEEWRAHVGGGRRQAILLEDVFGRDQLHGAALRDWAHAFPTIQQLSAGGTGRILLTARDAILDTIHAEHGTFPLLLSHTLNLTGSHACLSEEEKKSILRKHLERAGKSVSEEMLEDVAQSANNAALFPAQCRLFAESLLEDRESLAVFTDGPEETYSTCGAGPKVFLWISPDIIKKSLMQPARKVGRWGMCFTNKRGDIQTHFGDNDWAPKEIRDVSNSAGRDGGGGGGSGGGGGGGGGGSGGDGGVCGATEAGEGGVEGGQTDPPFLVACRKGNMQSVLDIMAAGQVDVSVSRENGFTALHVAALAGQAGVVEILLKGQCSVDAVDKEYWTPLHVACYGGHTEVVRLLIMHAAKLEVATLHGMRPLHIACRYGHTDLVRLLLQNGAVTEGKASPGLQACALHVAAFYGHADVISLLLQFRAQTSVKDRSGWLPLHYACQNGHLSVVEQLLTTATASAGHGPSQGQQLQVSCPHGHTQLVRELLQCGLCTHDSEGKTAVCRSCYLSNKLALENLSRHHTYPDQPSSGGVPALFLAAQNGHAEVVHCLLKAGACVGAAVSLGWTSLLIASYKGHPRVLQLLLQYKADVQDPMDSVLLTPLHLASANGHREVVEILLQNGAAPDPRDNYGISPVHRACLNGHSNVLPCLLARVREVYSDEESAGKLLTMAIENGCDEVVYVLHEWIPTIFKITENSAAFLEACRQGKLQIVKAFLEQDVPVNTHCNVSNYRGKTPIHVASMYKHPVIVETLIRHGARVNEQMSYGETIHETFVVVGGKVHVKTSHGDTALNLACREKCIDVVRVLLEEGCADTRIKNTDDETCLHIAARQGSADIVTLLMAHKADVNAQNEDGETPLICGRRDSPVVDVLLEHKADASIKTTAQDTVLHMVCGCGLEQSLHSLLRHKVHLETIDGNGETALLRACRAKRNRNSTVRLLLENEANVEAANTQGVTPVQLACQLGDVDLLQQLLQSGGRVNTSNNTGETPLHHASSQGHSRLIEVLLQAGACINERDHEGNAPLHKACVSLQTAAVRALLTHGADSSVRNKEGISPMTTVQSLNLAEDDLSEEERRDKLDKRTEIMLAFLEFNQRVANTDCHITVARDTPDTRADRPQHTGSGNSGDVSQVRHSGESIDVSHVDTSQAQHTGESTVVAAVDRMTETGLEENGREEDSGTPKGGQKTRVQTELYVEQDTENFVAEENMLTAKESVEHERDHAEDIDSTRTTEDADDEKIACDDEQISKTPPSFTEQAAGDHECLHMTKDGTSHENWNRTQRVSHETKLAVRKRNVNVSENADSSNDQWGPSGQDSSSLRQACSGGNTDQVLHHLLTSSDVDAVSQRGHTALHCACAAGQQDIAALLLQHGARPALQDASGRTCLHEAAARGHLTTVDLLLTRGVDTDATDSEKRTALHLAAGQGHGLVTALLVSHGAVVDATDHFGNTPLMLACRGNHSDACVMLLNSGASLEGRNKVGESVTEVVRSSNLHTLEKLMARHASRRSQSATEKARCLQRWSRSPPLCVVLVVGVFVAWAVWLFI
ncbi:hypothetical protein ACOMHN_043623 [Nucella lapillus]